MPYVFFHEYFPEIAKQETRSVTIVQTPSVFGLPAGDYGLMEMYCNETGCDCRRVMWYVVSHTESGVEAVVVYGWENWQFYVRWFGHNDPTIIEALKGPVLNVGSPRTALAPAILEMIKEVIIPDANYIERVKRHYAMVRLKVDGRAPAPVREQPRSTEKKKRKR
jgi:hypothetical protein